MDTFDNNLYFLKLYFEITSEEHEWDCPCINKKNNSDRNSNNAFMLAQVPKELTKKYVDIEGNVDMNCEILKKQSDIYGKGYTHCGCYIVRKITKAKVKRKLY